MELIDVSCVNITKCRLDRDIIVVEFDRLGLQYTKVMKKTSPRNKWCQQTG